MRDFKRLKVWRAAHELALGVYRASRGFPRSEQYALTNQARRAAASIPANLAEGCGRAGDPELARFVSIAMGSAMELEYHLLLAADLEYMPAVEHGVLAGRLDEVQRMLAALHRKVTASG